VYVRQAWRMEIRHSDWPTRRRIVRTPGLENGDTFSLAGRCCDGLCVVLQALTPRRSTASTK